MKRHLPIRLAVCAALAGSALMTAVAIPGGIAAASAPTVSCANEVGNETSQALTVCTGTGVNSMNASSSGTQTVRGIKAKTTPTTVEYTIAWKTTGKVTALYSAITAACTTSTCLKKCPKYSSPATDYITIGKGSSVVSSFSVTVGKKTTKYTTTTKALIGETVSGNSCVYKNGHVVNVGPTKL